MHNTSSASSNHFSNQGELALQDKDTLAEATLLDVVKYATLVSIRGQARTARIDKLELDEGFQPYQPPFRKHPWLILAARAGRGLLSLSFTPLSMLLCPSVPS